MDLPVQFLQVSDAVVAEVSEEAFRKRRANPNYSAQLMWEYTYVTSRPENGTSEEFSRPENLNKNRYHDVPCWDATRVRITPKNGRSDYIHANYVNGYNQPKKFIATQGPLAGTVYQFWQMIWEQKTRIIVMLTELKVRSTEKCARYWSTLSDDQDTFETNEFSIRTISESITENSGCIVTMLQVSDSITGEKRLVNHYRYIDWEDYGVPPSSKTFIAFSWDLNRQYKSDIEVYRMPAPIVVHCSAGVGRTGTFCAIDYCIHKLSNTGKISVPKVVIDIRQQRKLSVLDPKQYVFIYDVLFNLLIHFDVFPFMRPHVIQDIE